MFRFFEKPEGDVPVSATEQSEAATEAFTDALHDTVSAVEAWRAEKTPVMNMERKRDALALLTIAREKAQLVDHAQGQAFRAVETLQAELEGRKPDYGNAEGAQRDHFFDR